MLLTALTFILILGLLVFVHELGHFLAAKKSGVTVHEFAFGFRPRLVGWKRGQTEYAINLIPLGGYVRLEGEQDDSNKKGSLSQASIKNRVLILSAGVVMNIALAWILLTLTYMVGSAPLTSSFDKHPHLVTRTKIAISEVVLNSPAGKAGLQKGDTIVAINGDAIQSSDTLVNVTKQKAGQPITIRYSRNNQSTEVIVTPRTDPPKGEGALGISIDDQSKVSAAWYYAPIVAVRELGSEVRDTLIGFFGFLNDLFTKHKVNQNVTGIVGVGEAVGVVRRIGFAPLMQLTALISLNLAILNILPIPVLDGGHLFFLAIEAIRRKPVAAQYRQWLTLAGLVVILLLFLVVTYQDIINFGIIGRIKELF